MDPETHERDSSKAWDAPLGRVRKVEEDKTSAANADNSLPYQSLHQSSYATAAGNAVDSTIRGVSHLRLIPLRGQYSTIKASQAPVPVAKASKQDEGPSSTASAVENARNPLQLRSRMTGTPHESKPVIEDAVTLALKKYRQEPEGDRSIYSRGFLMLGPIKEFSNAELDKFRSTLSCYIFQAPDKLSVFIYGADSQTVMTALLGLREILLRKIQMLPKEANVPSTADRIPAKILLARLLEPGRLVKIPVTNNILITQFEFREHDAIISLQKIPNVDLPAESEWKAWSKRLDSVQKGVLKLVVLNRISLLMSTGDGCFLKVKMGVCVFKNYIWKPRNAANIPVSDFIQGLEHDRTDAIISNLNHDPALLKNALQQSHLLSGPNSKSLDTVKPCYEALFEFNSVGKAISTRQLHATGAYEDARPNVEMIWRKSAASNRVHQVLEVFMCRFNDGLSWKIQIDAAQSPPILSEEDRTFAASVNLESYDRDTEPMSAPRLRFQFVQNNNVRRVSQKTIWRTVLRSNSRWLVDVVRYDIFTKNQKGRTWSTGRPYWEILVHHRKWSFFNSSNTGNDSTIRQIKSILLPDDNEVEEHETVGIFCEMMDKISDAMSPSMI